MAIKPNDGETFLREVDEELRKEQINDFVARWGWAIIAGIVLFLAAVGGWIWWQHRQAEQAGEQGQILLEALGKAEANDRQGAQPLIDRLAGEGNRAYRTAAMFLRANSETAAGNTPAAIQTLAAIAGDSAVDEPYREIALIRQTLLEFDSMQPQAVIDRMRPLARPGEPWFGTAGELAGLAYIKAGRGDLAGPLFARIARDSNVPDSIRTRAVQMAGYLGVNALPDAAGDGGPAAAAAPEDAPQTKE